MSTHVSETLKVVGKIVLRSDKFRVMKNRFVKMLDLREINEKLKVLLIKLNYFPKKNLGAEKYLY